MDKPFVVFYGCVFSRGFLFSSGRNLKGTGELNELKPNIWLAIICTRFGRLCVCLLCLRANECFTPLD